MDLLNWMLGTGGHKSGVCRWCKAEPICPDIDPVPLGESCFSMRGLAYERMVSEFPTEFSILVGVWRDRAEARGAIWDSLCQAEENVREMRKRISALNAAGKKTEADALATTLLAKAATLNRLKAQWALPQKEAA